MIVNNISALLTVHVALQHYSLVKSKADFSKRFLEKGASYLSSMQSRTRNVPDAVLAVLEWTLQRELLSYAQNPHLGAEYAIRLNHAFSCMTQQIQFVRRHRASLAALTRSKLANDAEPTRRPPEQGLQLGAN